MRSDKGKPRKDHVGEVYNRLTVISCAGQRSNRRLYFWNCRCECGKSAITTIHEMRSGRTKSCGCWREERKTTHGLSKTAEYARNRTLKHLFNLTPEMVQKKLETQNNCCSICKQPFINTPTVDHDHACCSDSDGKNRKTCGKCVRGMLCKQCNAGLGSFKDSPQILQNAISYLAEWNQKCQALQ
jgi:hypothetical protein